MNYSGPTEFCQLHCHTQFSVLDGVASPDQYFAECKARGWPAIAITEHGNLASVPDNYFAAQKHGVKYIPGCEIYFNDYEPIRQKLVEDGVKLSELKQRDPELRKKIGRNRHTTVYAKNIGGFRNLTKLTTQAYSTGMFYKPRIWFDKLAEYSKGLVIASGCINGPISHALSEYLIDSKKESLKDATGYLHKFKEVFKDDFYLEVQMPCLPELKDHQIFAAIIQLAKKAGVDAILTNDCHYLNKQDYEIQKLMMAIDQGVEIDSENLFISNSHEQYFKTRAGLYETFKTNKYSDHVSDEDFEWICDNTLKLAETCDDFKPNTSLKIPAIPDADEKLKKMVYEQLHKRGLYDNEEKFMIDNRWVTYREQAELELNRFIEKGFAGYFLITADIVRFSNEHGWPVGPRGSASGSLVNHLIGISSVDPLKWQLSFNRFLSPARGGKILNIKAE